jgi:hypothetical protein
MFDRFKKSLFGEDGQPSREETPKAVDRPSPGGFGRRQSPVGAAEQNHPAPPPSANAGFGRRATPPGATSQGNAGQGNAGQGNAGQANAAPTAAAPAPEIKNDVSKDIVDWLMVELRDGRGIHCETMLTVLGALAGFAAQQSVWSATMAAGIMPQQAFTVMRTKSGESFYFNEAVNQLLASTTKGTPSVWQLVAEVAQAAGAQQLPDLMGMFKHTSSVLGSDQFGVPRLPQRHMPRYLPREALNRFWPKARALMEHTKPELWPMWLSIAAAKTIMIMKDACAPELACTIVMEAAVPMSKVDPATVPKQSQPPANSAAFAPPPKPSASHDAAQPQAQPLSQAQPDAAESRDLTRPILDWLTKEIADESGAIHCETAMTVLGALAGFAAQQAVWAGIETLGTPQQLVFNTARTQSGETFYLSDMVNDILAGKSAGKGEPPSILAIVAGAAAKAGGRDFPDIKGIFSNAMETMGSQLFGRPRAAAAHMPRILPRDALARYWRAAHGLVEREHPAMQVRWFALAAGSLLIKLQQSCPADIAFALVMEAAVPMSRIDPATVPK